MKKLLLIVFIIAAMNAMEKSSFDPQKYIRISLNIEVYREDNFDQKKWEEIVKEIKNYKSEPFSIIDLNATITTLYLQTINAPGIWGNVSKTYSKDAKKIDGPKNKKGSN